MRRLHTLLPTLILVLTAQNAWSGDLLIRNARLVDGTGAPPRDGMSILVTGAAGFSPQEAIAAATRTPAAMLGLDEQLGTVEVGKRADMVILAGDPLEDLGALRSIRWTVKGDVARAPEEWMRR